MLSSGDFRAIREDISAFAQAPASGPLPSYLLHGSCGSLLIHLGIAGSYSLYLWCAAWVAASDLPQWLQPPRGVNALAQTAARPIVLQAAFSDPVDSRTVRLTPAAPLQPVRTPTEPVPANLSAARIPPAAISKRPSSAEPAEAGWPEVAACRPGEHRPRQEPSADTQEQSTEQPQQLAKRDHGRDPATARSVATLASRADEGTDREELPQSVYSPAPEYPLEPYEHRVGGVVRIVVRLQADGTVASSSIYQSSGNGPLDRAALQAVAQWRFEARSPRRITARRVVVPIRFIPPAG